MKNAITRREFISRGLASAAALSTPGLPLLAGCSSGAVAPGGARRTIIVVGAGLAGLSAAFELTLLGHDVTVIEARTRSGGRVLTIREAFSDGLYAEAGAARIQDTHRLVLRYASRFNLELEPFWPEDGRSFLHLKGRRFEIPTDQPLDLSNIPLEFTDEERRLGVRGIFRKYIVPTLSEIGDPATPGWPGQSLRQYDDLSWREFLSSRGASEGVLAYFSCGHDFGASSALQMLSEISHEIQTERWFRVKGGNDLLPRAFAERLTDRIHYGVPVVRIEQHDDGVTAVFRRGDSFQRVHADRLICTVPLPVLGRIEMSPPLSAGKQRAIETLSYLPATRVLLQSSRRFWRDEGLNGYGRSDVPMEIWDHALGQPGSRGILGCYFTWEASRRLQELEDLARVTFAVARVREMLPSIDDHIEGAYTKCWDEDEWSRGAAAWCAPGQLTSLFPDLRTSEGRIHFAGEHTSVWNSWMEGALESGNRAAQEINNLQ